MGRGVVETGLGPEDKQQEVWKVVVDISGRCPGCSAFFSPLLWASRQWTSVWDAKLLGCAPLFEEKFLSCLPLPLALPLVK